MVVHGYMCRGEECCIVMMFYPFDIRCLTPSSHSPPPTPAHPPIQREPPLQDALGAEGGPKIVTEALARFEDDTEIQTVGCDAVQSLCYSHTVNTAALQVRGEEGERETGGLRGGAAAVLTNPPFTNPSHVLTMPAKRDFSLHLNVHLYSFHSNSVRFCHLFCDLFCHLFYHGRRRARSNLCSQRWHGTQTPPSCNDVRCTHWRHCRMGMTRSHDSS